MRMTLYVTSQSPLVHPTDAVRSGFWAFGDPTGGFVLEWTMTQMNGRDPSAVIASTEQRGYSNRKH